MKPFANAHPANAASILPARIPADRTQTASRPAANLEAHPQSHPPEAAPVAPLQVSNARTHQAPRPATAIRPSNPNTEQGTQEPQ
jgi:hypothetical protein